MFAGRGKIVSHSSSRTSAILKYFGLLKSYFILIASTNMACTDPENSVRGVLTVF